MKEKKLKCKCKISHYTSEGA